MPVSACTNLCRLTPPLNTESHVLVAMVVGYMLAEAPGWANLDGGGGNHLCSGALLALLGVSLGVRAKGPFSWYRKFSKR